MKSSRTNFIFLLMTISLGLSAQLPWFEYPVDVNITSGADTARIHCDHRIYAGISNNLTIETNFKDKLHITVTNGYIEQIKDSLYKMVPQVSGACIIHINTLSGTLAIQETPLPDNYFPKGFQILDYIPGYGGSDIMSVLTIDDLIEHNTIEAKFGENIYRIDSFICWAHSYSTREEFYSEICTRGEIDTTFLRFLDNFSAGFNLNLKQIWLTAPDSSRMYTDWAHMGFIYQDRTQYLLHKYISKTRAYRGRIRANADIRIQLKGDPSVEDIETIDSIIYSLNSLQNKIKLKMVKNLPTYTIEFSSDDSIHGRGAITGRSRKIQNTFFPLHFYTRLYLNTSIDQSERDLILWEELSCALLNYSNEDSYKERSMSTIIGKNQLPGLTKEDEQAIRAIFSKGAEKAYRNLFEKKQYIPDSLLFLALLLSVLLILLVREIYNYLSISRFIKPAIIRILLFGLVSGFISAMSFILIRSVYKPYTPYNFQTGLFILTTCAFSILFFLFLHLMVKAIRRFNSRIIELILNPLATLLSLFLAYQAIFFITHGELLKFYAITGNNITIAIVVLIIEFFLTYQGVKIHSLLKEKELELSKQEELKNRAELNALEARINPHFLYNSLNSIASLAAKDPEKTEKMAVSLSKLFRFNLNREDNHFSTVRKEIEMVEIFLEIEKVRYTDRLHYEIHVEEALYDKKIPKMIIQPLVENAVKHGIAKITEQGKIVIRIYEKEDSLFIEVCDNGPEFPEGLLSGYGLQNIYEKLSLLYKKPYEVRFVNSPEKYIQLKLS